MIDLFKIDYTFKKGGPTYNCSYPLKKDSNNNIFLIRGDCDHGKTTIMQMVALGLYGTETGEIGELLKEKILRLISKDVDICKFDFTIVSKDGKTKIEASLDAKNGKPQVSVNGQPKPPDFVKNNFQIIFDVPEETTKKIASALKSMEYKLIGYETYLQRYIRGVSSCIEKIEAYEDKESRQKDEQKQIADMTKKRDGFVEQLKGMRSDFKELEKAYVVNFFEDNQSKFAEIDGQIKTLDKRIKKFKSAGVGGGNKGYFEKGNQLYQHNGRPYGRKD